MKFESVCVEIEDWDKGEQDSERNGDREVKDCEVVEKVVKWIQEVSVEVNSEEERPREECVENVMSEQCEKWIVEELDGEELEIDGLVVENRGEEMCKVRNVVERNVIDERVELD